KGQRDGLGRIANPILVGKYGIEGRSVVVVAYAELRNFRENRGPTECDRARRIGVSIASELIEPHRANVVVQSSAKAQPLGNCDRPFRWNGKAVIGVPIRRKAYLSIQWKWFKTSLRMS